MTRPTKHRFRWPELSSTSSASAKTPKRNHHRKTHKFHRSPPQEPYPSDVENEYENDEEEEEEEEDEDEYGDEEELTSVTSPNDQFTHSLPPNPLPNSPKPITQTDSYINIAAFPSFKGSPGECPATHLTRFAKVCRANNVSSVEAMMRIFPVTLEDEAARWYDLNVEPYPFLTWEETKSLFSDAYRVPDYDKKLRSELMNLNQAPGEPVRSYFLRLQWILNQWPGHGIPDPLVKGIFVDGLRRDFKDWVVPQKPGSLGDALRLAFTWEQVRIIRSIGDGETEEVTSAGGERKEKVLEDENEHEEDEEEEGVVVYGGKKSGCKCSKHQCGKKRLERNKSGVSVVTKNSSNFG